MNIGSFFRTALISFALLMLSGCQQKMASTVPLPNDIKAVTQPFLRAVTEKQFTKAEKYIGRGAVDEAREQFADAQVTLSTAPKLRPVMMRYKPTAFGQPDTNDVTVLYAAKADGLWTSVHMRLFRLEGEPYEIQYFYVNNEAEMPQELAMGQRLRNWLMIGLAAMAFMGVLALGLILWLVKKKRHLLAPQSVIDARKIAATHQND